MQVISSIRNFLIKYGIYDHFEWSLPHQIWLALRHPENRIAIRQESNFFSELLPKGTLVFDIGANMGNKSAVFLKSNCKVIAVDADPKAYRLLRKRFWGNPKISILHVAVGDNTEPITFYQVVQGGAYSSAKYDYIQALIEQGVISNEQVRKILVNTITLNQCIEDHGIPFYIKIDIEGNELNCLNGLSHPVSLLSFEANLWYSREQSIACCRQVTMINPNYQYNYVVDIEKGFILDQWLPFEGFVHHLESDAPLYMDIFCKLIPAP